MRAKDSDTVQVRIVALQNAERTLSPRQQAEEALLKQTEWLRITLASIGDAVISTDAEGRVSFLNGVAEKLIGWLSSEALGRQLPDVFHIVDEETREVIECPALRCLREDRTIGFTNQTILIARDGSERPIDDSTAPIRSAVGAAVGAVIVFRDTTERRMADSVQVQLAAIVTSSDDAIVSKTLDGIIRSWNHAAERLFGYAACDAVGQNITLIIPPERREEETRIVEQLRRGKRIEHFETVRVAKDGRRLDISLTVSPLRDRNGTIVGASKVARDITQRKRSAKLLRQSEEQARLALDIARTGTWKWIRSTGEIVADARCREICGMPAEGSITLADVTALIGSEDWPSIDLALRKAMQSNSDGLFVEELRVVSKSGSVRWVSGRGKAFFDLDFPFGPPTQMIGTILDITERKRLERDLFERADALLKSDRKKDEFIALLAHELRNPLAPLRNGLQILHLGADNQATVARTRNMMERQLGHMVRLIDDLLDVSRINQNKMALRRSQVALADIVENAVESARPAIESAQHEFVISLPQEPLFLDADLTRLAQVFSNLLTNSANYTEPGGRIWLTAEERDAYVAVSVRDTGIGIPPGDLPRIFDMFSQVNRSVERSAGGLGIGLALVKGLVEMHGGTVSATSEGSGKGATFQVELPLLPTRPDPNDGRHSLCNRLQFGH